MSSADVQDETQQTRAANRAEAVAALEVARRWLSQRDWERAYRAARRAFLLAPLPEISAALEEARAGARADPDYCSECYRHRVTCTCGGAARGPGQRGTAAPPPPFAPHAPPFPPPPFAGAFDSLSRGLATHLHDLYLRWEAFLLRNKIAPSYVGRLTFVAVAIVVLGVARLLGAGPILRPGGHPTHPGLLPGDIHYSSPGGGFSFHAPVVSSLVITLLANVLLQAAARSGRGGSGSGAHIPATPPHADRRPAPQ